MKQSDALLPEVVHYTFTPQEDFILRSYYAIAAGILNGEQSTPDVLIILRNLRTLQAGDQRCAMATAGLHKKIRAMDAFSDTEGIWGPK
jgi:hypothetical protein